jgi:hypothetical protein
VIGSYHSPLTILFDEEEGSLPAANERLVLPAFRRIEGFFIQSHADGISSAVRQMERPIGR